MCIFFVILCIYSAPPKFPFLRVCVVSVVVPRFMAYDIMLWSQLLSSSLILQSVIVRSTLLVVSLKSMLLLPIRYSKVVFVLGSFILSSFLLIMYSTNYFPQFFYVVSCHVVGLAFLSIAMMTIYLTPCFSILLTLVKSFSMGISLSQYMLANISAVSPLVISSVMVSSSECFNLASTALFLIVMAVQICAYPAV